MVSSLSASMFVKEFEGYKNVQQVFYDKDIGKIELHTEISSENGAFASIWVIYPDGVGEEVATLIEAYKKLH
jgi:hypothetical protein